MSIKTVVITGANRGLGLELARALSTQQNTRIIGTARNPAAATELAALPNVSVIRLDISDLSSIPKFAEDILRITPDGVDILWNVRGLFLIYNDLLIPPISNPAGFSLAGC